MRLGRVLRSSPLETRRDEGAGLEVRSGVRIKCLLNPFRLCSREVRRRGAPLLDAGVVRLGVDRQTAIRSRAVAGWR